MNSGNSIGKDIGSHSAETGVNKSPSDELITALADAHRAVDEARLLVADRAVLSSSPVVEFEAVFNEYEAAYVRFRHALLELGEVCAEAA